MSIPLTFSQRADNVHMSVQHWASAHMGKGQSAVLAAAKLAELFLRAPELAVPPDNPDWWHQYALESDVKEFRMLMQVVFIFVTEGAGLKVDVAPSKLTLSIPGMAQVVEVNPKEPGELISEDFIKQLVYHGAKAPQADDKLDFLAIQFDGAPGHWTYMRGQLA